ncbi:MAG: dethiobiotin synthase [Planctomycetales bacterium]|nr:dethiobiotin synthase [Planctomycetales bacterium]
MNSDPTDDQVEQPRPQRPRHGLFIVGSNTEVGKTRVACAVARAMVAAGLRVGVYKPAASGAVRRDGTLVSTDAEELWNAAGRPLRLDAVCPQVFEAPLAPHLAARAEGKQLDARLLRTGADAWRSEAWDVLVVEGAGGLLSPISDDDYVADLALDFDYPLLIVVPNALGVIGQTLQTLVAATAYRRQLPMALRRPTSRHDLDFGQGLTTAGIVLNQPQPPDPSDCSLLTNGRELATRCAVPILGELAYGQTDFEPPVDWRTLLGLPPRTE